MYGFCFDMRGQRSGSTDPRAPPFRRPQPKEYASTSAELRAKTHHKTHMMKLFVALALAAAPSARGMAPYVPATAT